MKKKVISLVLGLSLIIGVGCFTGCGTEAERVSHNVSQEADNFNVLRRLAVINSRTDKVEFELIGAFSLEVDSAENQIEITAEMEDGTYKKHFVGLNDNTMYVIEDLGGAKVNKYKYEVNYIPEMIAPIEIVTKK